MRRFLVHWFVVTVSLAVAAYMLPGVGVDTLGALLWGGLALGFVNAVVRPLLKLLTFPLTVFTLGLSLLIVNGVAFAMATWLVQGLVVDNLWWAIGAAVVVSVVSWVLSSVGGKSRGRTRERDSATRARAARD